MRSSNTARLDRFEKKHVTFAGSENGVANGTRTRDSQNHNLELYH